MSPQPTGRVVSTTDGRDLVLTRTFEADIDDVWASITEPERTARWFAAWSGEPEVGATIRYRLTFEEGAEEADMRIDACEPPRLLAVSASDDYGSWRLEARLSQTGPTTTLEFVQHLDDSADVGSIGPGWEYYLDMLAAVRDGRPQPVFNDYFPAQQQYYTERARTAAD